MSWEKKVRNEMILEDYKKRFSQILEYTFPTNSVLAEDGEEEETPEEMPEEAPEEIPEETPEMNNTDGGEMGGDMPMDNNEMPQEEPAADMGGEDLTSGFTPEENMDDMTDTMQPEDEVVDITELTDAQEETQEDIEQFGAAFQKAFKVIKSLEDMVNNTSSKIDNLEQELKKRNPTPIEKMNNRAAVSYPFNVSPQEYWEEKEKTSNYSTEDDKNGADSEEYQITVGDIMGARDWKNISDSLTNDLLHNQTLSNILKF